MFDWLCAACAVEYPAGEQPPAACPICLDERQYVPLTGQAWTSLQQLSDQGSRVDITEAEPDLYILSAAPEAGIGQHAKLVRTSGGNLLWDPTGYVDEAAAERVKALGGAEYVVASHPHMYGAQSTWARLLDATVLVAEADRNWVQRADPRIDTFTGDVELLPGVTLRTIGGHFPGSSIVHWAEGAEGRGVVLAGDTFFPGPSGRWVTFMRSYPNAIPMSAPVVGRVAAAVAAHPFDRAYGNFGNRIMSDARGAVLRSADRYIAWVSGANDHLT
ncbi:MBL fold metallo-hydrolase [Diaminobutyricibacter sp. McL0618]|uniref:MBL fold metallo-hydrolase n=1 Tax=Leifsonia sp. McL0618 TaxID=3415677 RepID=UPI003CF43E85